MYRISPTKIENWFQNCKMVAFANFCWYLYIRFLSRMLQEMNRVFIQPHHLTHQKFRWGSEFDNSKRKKCSWNFTVAYEVRFNAKNPQQLCSHSISTEENRNKSAQIHTWLLCKGRQMKITGTCRWWMGSEWNNSMWGWTFHSSLVYMWRERKSHEYKSINRISRRTKRKWRTSNIEHTSITSHYFRKTIIILQVFSSPSSFLIVNQNLRA